MVWREKVKYGQNKVNVCKKGSHCCSILFVEINKQIIRKIASNLLTMCFLCGEERTKTLSGKIPNKEIV